MKVLLVASALFAAACAYDMKDVPDHMKDRLDRFITLKNDWREKWIGMSEFERKNYEQVLLTRLEHIPEMQHQRLHDKIESLPEEQRANLLGYFRSQLNMQQEQVGSNGDEIDVIIKALPDFIRQKLNEVIWIQFQEATAYNMNADVS